MKAALFLSLLLIAPARLFAEDANGIVHPLFVHYRCGEWAKVRLLNPQEVEMCNSIYLSIKLHFAGGVDAEDFHKSPAVERARINRLGYVNFKKWEGENSRFISRMIELAQIDN